MPTILQLTGKDLLDLIVATFSAAAGTPLTPASRLKNASLPFGKLLKAVRTLDVAGAFIPENSLKDPTHALRDFAADSQAFVVTPPAAVPTTWDRVRGVLAQAGAMRPRNILPNTPLTQIGVGSDWIGFLDNEFEVQGLRFFDADFKKAETAGDVFDIVFDLLDQKVTLP